MKNEMNEDFLLKLKNELESLEEKINSSKSVYYKQMMILKLKITLLFVRRIAPYLLTTGIMISVFELFNIYDITLSNEEDLYTIFGLMTVFAEFIPFYYRKTITKFDYNSSVLKLKHEYSKYDINELNKRLEIRKNNYERFMK